MTVDLALNLIWLILGASAILATRYAHVRSRRGGLNPVRFISVVVVLAALFPYVSALDDTLQVAQIQGEFATASRVDSASPATPHSSELVWLFESMNDAVTGTRAVLAPHFAEYAVTRTAAHAELRRVALPSNGRAPPAV